MEKKDRNEELMELKEQMEILKQKLHKSDIVDETKTMSVVKKYSTGSRRLKYLYAIVCGVGMSFAFFYRLIVSYNEMSAWQLVGCILMTMFFVLMNSYIIAGHAYSVQGDRLVRQDIFKRKTKNIPIASIRFIEFTVNKTQKARIMYNKYDEFYLYDVNDFTELIQEILRVNPDIEIRREKSW